MDPYAAPPSCIHYYYARTVSRDRRSFVFFVFDVSDNVHYFFFFSFVFRYTDLFGAGRTYNTLNGKKKQKHFRGQYSVVVFVTINYFIISATSAFSVRRILYFRVGRGRLLCFVVGWVCVLQSRSINHVVNEKRSITRAEKTNFNNRPVCI